MTVAVEAGLSEVVVSGARIRVRDTGDPAAPPVLLLHGIGRSLEDWSPQHDRLSDTFRVLSTDLAGFGLSDRLPGPATMHALTGGVLGVLDAVGERRPVHLMGNSLGGAVALMLLTGAPERVATLTLADPAGFGSEVTPALRILGVPFLGARLLRSFDRAAARRTERALFLDDALVTEERITHAIEVARRPDHAAVFAEIAAELGTPLRGVRPGWRSRLLAEAARHPRPTLVVWGERDLILPARHLHAALAAIPHARSHVFGRTGHLPQIERADAFAGLVRTFLESAATGRHPSSAQDSRSRPGRTVVPSSVRPS